MAGVDSGSRSREHGDRAGRLRFDSLRPARRFGQSRAGVRSRSARVDWRAERGVGSVIPDATGLLPPRWRWLAASEVGDVQLGRQRSPKNRSANFPTPYLRAANITECGLD